MIIMRDVLVRPGMIDSERVCALPIACQLFFRNLLHCCDGRGLFPADAAELRAALYRRAPRVSNPHVEAWLTQCHQARLVKLYTRGGKAYGEVLHFGQRDLKRRHLYPPPDDEEPELFTTGPPLKSMKEGKGREGKAPEAPPQAAPAPPILSDSDWSQQLVAAWPSLHVYDEIARASIDRQKKGKRLERAWFEKYWLPKCSPVIKLDAAQPARRTVAEPEGWRVYLKDQYENESWAESAGAMDWIAMPRHWQEQIVREMKGVA